jgi:Glycosyl hydrolase family 3 C terminal domain.
MTLLKNEASVLPLAKDRKVLVTGPTADSLIALSNGWTYVWQGNNISLYPKDRPTVLKAIRNKVGDDKVTYVPGVSFDKEIDIDAAVNAAQQADVAVVCIGESSYTKRPATLRTSLSVNHS